MKKFLAVFLLMPRLLCGMDSDSASDDFEKIGEARVVDEVFADDDGSFDGAWALVKHAEEIADDKAKRGASAPVAAGMKATDLQVIKSVEEALDRQMAGVVKPEAVRPVERDSERVPLSVAGRAYALRDMSTKKGVDKSESSRRKAEKARLKYEQKKLGKK